MGGKNEALPKGLRIADNRTKMQLGKTNQPSRTK